jgi:excisionase family DNA binding protein
MGILMDEIPFPVRARFLSAAPQWTKGGLLVPALEPWRPLYDRVEETRSAKSAKALYALADAIDKSRACDAPGRLSFLALPCQAVAELLLREPRRPKDRDLALRLLGICPPRGWPRLYFQLLEARTGEVPDLALVRSLGARGLALAEAKQEDLDVLRTFHALVPPDEKTGGEPVPPPPDLLDAKDLAKLLGCSVVHARRLMAKGKIPSRKFGRSRRVRRDDLLKLFAPDDPRFRHWR